MPAPVGLLFASFIIKAILGGVIAVALVLLFWKIGKLVDAYTQKLKGQ